MAPYLLSLYSHQGLRNKNKTLLKRILLSAGKLNIFMAYGIYGIFPSYSIRPLTQLFFVGYFFILNVSESGRLS